MSALMCRAKLASGHLISTFSLIAISMHHMACTLYLSVISCFCFACSLYHIQSSYYYAHNYNKIKGESLRLKLSDSHAILFYSNLADCCTGYISVMSVLLAVVVVLVVGALVSAILVKYFWKTKNKIGRLVCKITIN